MSTLTKIFVVLNLILSAGFCFFSMTYYGYSTDWKSKYEEKKSDVEEKKRQIQLLTDKSGVVISALNDELNRSRERVHTLEGEVQRQKDEKENIRRDFNQLQSSYESLSSDMRGIGSKIEKIQAENSRLREEIDDNREKKERAEAKARLAVDMANEADVQKNFLLKQLNDLRKNYHGVSEELSSKTLIINRLRDNGVDVASLVGVPGPKVDGKVTGAKASSDIYLISVGENDGVKVGMEFKVHRDGNYLGSLRVYRVSDTWAACESVLDTIQADIGVGDNVSTYLRY